MTGRGKRSHARAIVPKIENDRGTATSGDAKILPTAADGSETTAGVSAPRVLARCRCDGGGLPTGGDLRRGGEALIEHVSAIVIAKPVEPRIQAPTMAGVRRARIATLTGR